jgi:hypothetical protein
MMFSVCGCVLTFPSCPIDFLWPAWSSAFRRNPMAL